MDISKDNINGNKLWSQEEIDQLIKEYNDDELTVMELAKIHNRLPSSISICLKKINIIDNTTHVRGYLEYKNSDFFREKKKAKTNDEVSLDTNIIEVTTDIPNEIVLDDTIELSKEFINNGEHWTQYEDKQLLKEYNIDELGIMEISKIHKRTTGGICARLKKLNIIDKKINARGYLKYKNSELYKERCLIKSKRGRKPKTKINEEVSLDTNIVESPSDITQIKNDITQIKDYISKLHELLFILCAKNDDES